MNEKIKLSFDCGKLNLNVLENNSNFLEIEVDKKEFLLFLKEEFSESDVVELIGKRNFLNYITSDTILLELKERLDSQYLSL